MKSERYVLFILVLGLLVALGPLSIDMYLPAFPKIATGFSVPISMVELSLASFFAGVSVGQLIYGALTDRFGRKPPVYLGLTLFFVSSLACAYAPSVEALIAFRFFQALGGSAGMVVSRAMVRDLFEPQEAAQVFSALMLVMGVAPMLGPLMGGYVSTQWGWQAIFLFVAVMSVISFSGVWRLLPETHLPNKEVRASKFIRHYLEVFKDRNFVRFALTGGISQAGMFAYIASSPKVFIEYFGLSPVHYGWLFGSNAFGFIVVAQINSRLLRRFPPEKIVRIIIFIVFALSLALLTSGILGLNVWGVAIPLFSWVALLGMKFPNTMALAMAYQKERAGAASALLGTIQFVFAAITAGIVGMWHSDTPLPMTVVIAVCGFVSIIAYLLLAPPRTKISMPMASGEVLKS